MSRKRPNRRGSGQRFAARKNDAFALPIEGIAEVPFRYSDKLYLEILSRWFGQGPLVGRELGRAVELLTEAHRKTSAYAYSGCHIGVGFDGEELIYCGQPCTRRNHTIQKNGVLSTIAAERGEDLRVLRLTLNMLDVQEATRKGHPAKQYDRTTMPIWRVSRLSPEAQTINMASCVGLACPECDRDRRVFGLIDRPPPLGNLVLPATFEEYCTDCVGGGLASPAHKCIGKWMAELAYRSCHYKRNCLCGLLDALSDTRVQEMKKGNKLSIEIVDSYLREQSREVEALDRYLLLFEQRRLQSKGPAMRHHILDFQSAVDVASSNFLAIFNGSAASTYFAMNLYPQRGRHLAFVSYFAFDEKPNARQVHRILDSLAQETPAVPGKMLKEILGTWENAFARPDDYYQLPDEVKEEIESKKVDDGIKKSFGSMFRYLEKSPPGREMLSQLRRLGFSRRLPKSRFE